MEWIAALGIAYALTFLTAFPFRTTRFPRLFWGIFAFDYGVSLLLLLWVDLPHTALISLAVGGMLIGLILTFLWRFFARFENHSHPVT